MDERDESKRPPSRRTALKLLATAGATTALALVSREAVANPRVGTARSSVLVFRLSSRRTSACNACRNHHRFVISTSHALADAHRAHIGCNCHVVRQEMHRKVFKELFPTGEGVVDLRNVGRGRKGKNPDNPGKGRLGKGKAF